MYLFCLLWFAFFFRLFSKGLSPGWTGCACNTNSLQALQMWKSDCGLCGQCSCLFCSKSPSPGSAISFIGDWLLAIVLELNVFTALDEILQTPVSELM